MESSAGIYNSLPLLLLVTKVLLLCWSKPHPFCLDPLVVSHLLATQTCCTLFS